MQQIKVLDSGSVTLMNILPEAAPPGYTIEYLIVQAARSSYGLGLKTPEEDDKLIEYMYRNEHTSPFEMISFIFLVEAPIFVANQIMRHRTGSYNQESKRYTEADDRFYHMSLVTPEQCSGGGIRFQSTTNKQSSVESAVSAEVMQKVQEYESHIEETFKKYHELVQLGVAKECARGGLPMSMYTKFYMKMDLHNLLRFFRLRLHHTAQAETRSIAQAMYDLIKPHIPVVAKCFEKYTLNSIKLDADEIEFIKSYISDLKVMMPPIQGFSVRHARELKEKLEALGF